MCNCIHAHACLIKWPKYDLVILSLFKGAEVIIFYFALLLIDESDCALCTDRLVPGDNIPCCCVQKVSIL